MRVLRTKQLVPRAVIDTMDQRIQQVEQRLEDLIERFDMMVVDTNKDRDIDGRQPGARDAYDNLIN